MKQEVSSVTKFSDLQEGTVYADPKNNQFFMIFHEESLENPRKDNGGVMLLYTWEKDNPSPDNAPATREEFAEEIGVSADSWEELMVGMRKKGYFVMPIYALYHGGTSYSLHDFHDKYDSGQVGICFVNKNDPAIRDLSDSFLTIIAENEMNLYDSWAQGDVWGIETLDAHNNITDMSSGYICDKSWNATLEEMLSAVGVTIQDEYREAITETTVTYR